MTNVRYVCTHTESEGSQTGSTVPVQDTDIPIRTSVQRTTVHPALLVLYFATGIVLIHDSIVAGWWGILAATVANMIGMTVVLVLPIQGEI